MSQWRIKEQVYILNYLHEANRLHRFYTFEQFDIPRREFNEYLSWVAGELDSCQFGMKVEEVTDCQEGYLVKVRRLNDGSLSEYRAKHVVLGTGSKPMIPVDVPEAAYPYVTHSSRYLDQQKALHEAESVAVIGSGQSAAEIFLDLLQHQRKDSSFHGLRVLVNLESWRRQNLAKSFYTKVCRVFSFASL